jgi:hypothetical protein
MITESAHKPIDDDGFRARISDHTPVAVHRQSSTRVRSTPRVIDLLETKDTSISTLWMKFGRSTERDRGDVGQDCFRGRAVPGPGRTASAPSNWVSRVSTWFASTPHPERVAGLAELPNSVVALRAVPGSRARLFPTSCSGRVPRNRRWSRFHPLPHPNRARSPAVGHELHPCGSCPDSADHVAVIAEGGPPERARPGSTRVRRKRSVALLAPAWRGCWR